jgi:hypothetical protein
MTGWLMFELVMGVIVLGARVMDGVFLALAERPRPRAARRWSAERCSRVELGGVK